MLKSYAHKANNIFRNDGSKVFLQRFICYILVKIRRWFFSNKDLGQWTTLKDKYKDKRIFILGNGPSLNQTELFLLKDEYTMCFNRVNLMLERLNWMPNFYVMTDDLLIEDMSNEVVSEILPKVEIAFFPDIHPSNVNFRKRIGEHKNVFYLNTDIPEFRTDLPKCGINKTVVNAGMQIAAYLGFKEIYLLGVDMTFGCQKVKKNNNRNWTAEKDDDINHFDPRYFGKGRSYHNPTVHEMLEMFDIGSKFFDKIGVNVFNATIGGKLEVFPRVDFNNLFTYSDKIKEELFLNLIFPSKEISTIDEVLSKVKKIDSPDKFSEHLPCFYINIDILDEVMDKAIHTHIPFGPFQGYYIFKKRIY